MQFPVPSETFASLDVEALRGQGHELSVYGMRPKHEYYEELMVERRHSNLSVFHFSFFSVWMVFLFLIRHPSIFLSLLGWLLKNCLMSPKHLLKSIILLPSALFIFASIYKNKPDIVHLFWGHYPSMVGYLVKKYMPSTVVTMFLGAHDLVSAYPGSISLSHNVDELFTHSKSNLPMIAKLGINKCKANVIVRGTKLDFSTESDINKFDKLSSPIFLTAGRLIKEKGVDVVLQIFKSLLNSHSNAILYIAGDGPYKDSLVDMARSFAIDKNVVFLGHIEQTELIKIMARSHFFLLMSRYPSERLPNVVKEAMYQQCVVVTTNTSGIAELIEDNVEGFVVGMQAAGNALSCIDDCLIDQKRMRSISTAAKLKIKEKFDVNVSMSLYLHIWEDAINRKLQ